MQIQFVTLHYPRTETFLPAATRAPSGSYTFLDTEEDPPNSTPPKPKTHTRKVSKSKLRRPSRASFHKISKKQSVDLGQSSLGASSSHGSHTNLSSITASSTTSTGNKLGDTDATDQSKPSDAAEKSGG